MGTADAAGIGSTLADKIDREQRDKLAGEALRKRAAGQPLTHRELAALSKVERERTAHFGGAYLAAMPKGDYALLSGRQPKQLIELATKYGLPYPPQRTSKTVDVRAVIRWFHDFLARNSGQLASSGGESPEEAVLQLCSKELKDEWVREKIAGQRIGNFRSQLDALRLSENYVPLEPMRQFHNRLAELMRRTRGKLAKHFDGDHREFIEQAFDQLIDDWIRLNHAQFDTDADTVSATDRQWADSLDTAEVATDGAA